MKSTDRLYQAIRARVERDYPDPADQAIRQSAVIGYLLGSLDYVADPVRLEQSIELQEDKSREVA